MPHYHIYLTTSGPDEAAVIDKIVELTELNRDEATRIVREQDVIRRNVENQEAQRIAGELRALGAQVMLLPVGAFELPRGKALFIQLQDQDDQPVAGARIAIKTRNNGFDQALAPATSNKTGRAFLLDFSTLVTEFFKELPPVWWEVTQEGKTWPTIHHAFDWESFIRFPDTIALVQVQTKEHAPEEPEPTTDQFSISGTAFLANEAPAVGYTVRAYDRDLRSEQLLGEAETDAEGNYHIPYTPEQFRRADKGHADLRLRVFDKNEREVTIAPLREASSTLFNADPNTEANLHLQTEAPPPVTSLYDRMVAAITPLLDGATLNELTGEDAQFLNREVDFSASQLFWIAEDRRLTQQTGLPTSVFFAWALQEIGVDDEADTPVLDLAEVLQHDAATLVQENLRTAIDQEDVTDILAEPNADQRLIEQLQALQANNTEEPRRAKRQRIRALGDLAGLSEDETQTLQEWELDAALGNADLIDNLIAQGKIAPDRKDPLKLTLNLSALTEKRTELVEKLLQASVRNDQPAQQLKDFTAWDTNRWQTFLEENDIQPDTDSDSTKVYAEKLNTRVEQLYPTDTWFARNARQDRTSAWQKLELLQPLFERTDKLFTEDGIADVSLEEMDNPEQTQQTLQELNELSNLYAPLGLRERFNDPELSVDEKVSFAQQQIQHLQTFRQNNPDFDLINTSMSVFSDEVSFNMADIPKTVRPRIINTLKREQRLLRVTGNIGESQALARYGFGGAQDILGVPRQEFIASDVATTLGDAAAIYDRFRQIAADVVHKVLLVRETNSIFNHTLAGNLGKELDPLRRLPGYEEIFGSASYCKCQHCQSIFSPAAYFVDLMRWCEDYVPPWGNLNPDTSEAPRDTLSLKRRRPDLWTLPLTCENTNTLVPTLTIVNEVLESFIAAEVEAPHEGPLPSGADRRAIQGHVYGKLLSRFRHTRTLPFSLPHHQIKKYLEKFDRTIQQVAAVQAQETGWNRIALGATEEEFELLLNPRHTHPLLKELYPIGLLGSSSTSAATPQARVPDSDAYQLMPALGLTRDELGELLRQPYIHQGQVAIEQRKRPAPPNEPNKKSVQADQEVVIGLTYQTLDRMHRFLRLWRQLPDWTMGDLGLFLRAEAHPEIDENFLDRLPHYRFLAQRLDLAPAEVFSLVFRVADYPTQPGEDSLLNKRFNPVLFTELEEGLSGQLVFTHPAGQSSNAGGTNSTADPASLNRFLRALRISDDDLVRLLETPVVGLHHNQPLSFVPSTGNLTSLYRHATLAQQLELSVEDLLLAIRLCPSITNVRLQSLLEIVDLVDFVTSVRETGLSWKDLAQIIPDATQPLATNPVFSVVDAVLKLSREEQSLEFSRDTFALIPNIELPYAQGLFEQLVTANAVVPANGAADDRNATFRLAKEANISAIPLNIPDPLSSKGITSGVLQQHILKYSIESTITKYLSSALKVPAEALHWMLRVVNANLMAPLYYDATEPALIDPTTAAAPYEDLVNKLQPWVVLINALGVDWRAFVFSDDAATNAQLIRQVYGTTDEGAPTWETVRRLALWQMLSTIGLDRDAADDEERERKEAEHYERFQTFISQSATTLTDLITTGSEEERSEKRQDLVRLMTPVSERSSVTAANVRALVEQPWSNQAMGLLGRFDEPSPPRGEREPANTTGRLRAAACLRENHPLLRPLLRAVPAGFSTVSLDLLLLLHEQIQLKQTLGVGVDTMYHLLSSDYPTATQAARALRAALSVNYDTDAWTELATSMDEQLAQQQRDALQVFLLKVFPHLFQRHSDL